MNLLNQYIITIKKTQMMPRRRNQSYSPELKVPSKEDPMLRLRNTVMKLEERTSDLYLLRNSYSSQSLRTKNTQSNHSKGFDWGSKKKKPLQTLKHTLDFLENKINSAKEELQLPLSSMKKKNKLFIHIDDKMEKQDEEELNGNPSDSSITQKTTQKKVSSFVTSVPKPKNAKIFNVNPYSPRRHSIYYISETVRAINQKNSLALDHVNASIKMMKACQVYQIPEIKQMEHRKVNLKKHDRYKNKKTLILDLDQTLIHCVENPDSQSDMKLQIKIDGTSIKIGINIRPYALTFLKKMTPKFEIVIFTASHHSYADAILDQLDPEGEIFQHRLYRHHCHVLGNELHVKDLRILNRNLSEMILVDNAAYSYAFQLENGIPILPFYEGADFQLAALETYLQEIDKAQDVRQLNKKTFKLHHYSKFFNGEELIEQLYMNNLH